MVRLGHIILVLVFLSTHVSVGKASAQVSGDDERAVIHVLSDPVGAEIRVDGLEFSGTAPDSLVLDPGTWTLQLYIEGFQPLTHSLELASAEVVVLNFIMLQTPPEMPFPEDLGLAYMSLTPPRNETEALVLRKKYYALTETFLVFPLAQGLIGKLAFGEDSSFPADELLIAGIILVSLSALAGSYFSKKKLNEVQQANKQAQMVNEQAKAHNQEVDQALSSWHGKAILEWQTLTEGRGRVETTVVNPGTSVAK